MTNYEHFLYLYNKLKAIGENNLSNSEYLQLEAYYHEFKNVRFAQD